jgi:FHS family L-fucose permease-like MFS transporter
LGLIAKETGSVAKGYIVPLFGYVVVALYGLVVRRITARDRQRGEVS